MMKKRVTWGGTNVEALDAFAGGGVKPQALAEIRGNIDGFMRHVRAITAAVQGGGQTAIDGVIAASGGATVVHAICKVKNHVDVTQTGVAKIRVRAIGNNADTPTLTITGAGHGIAVEGSGTADLVLTGNTDGHFDLDVTDAADENVIVTFEIIEQNAALKPPPVGNPLHECACDVYITYAA